MVDLKKSLVFDSRIEHWNNVVKHSSVSTGQLNALLRLHIRPINLVVFQGTFVPEGTYET